MTKGRALWNLERLHLGFIEDLAIVLSVAAFTGIIFRALRQPSVPGYLVAGLIVGPYLPVPLFADPERVASLSEFGVVLVMFAIGLELRMSRLIRLLPVAGFTGIVQMSTLFWCGFSLTRLFGWSAVEGIFLGSCLAISSSMVVSKVFAERAVADDVKQLVLGVLVLQDVAAIGLIAATTAIAEGGGVSANEMIAIVVRLLFVLAALIVGGLVVVPRLVALVLRLGSREALVVFSCGLCFAFAVLANRLGYSLALGAFIAGVVSAEGGRAAEVEHGIAPVRDLFAAVFFVSVGMSVDPQLAFESIGPALIVFFVLVVAQLVSVTVGGVLSGAGLRRSVTAGLSLGQIGELSFILGGIGVAANVVRPSLLPILVTVSMLTAFSTAWALKFSAPLLGILDHRLPARIQNLLVLYETWLDRLRTSLRSSTERAPVLRTIRAIALDGVGLVVVVGFTARARPIAINWLTGSLQLPRIAAESIGWVVPFVVLIPLSLALIANTRRLSAQFVDIVFEDPAEGRWRGAREVLRRTVSLVVWVAVGVPAAALLRPLLQNAFVLPSVLIGMAVFAKRLWKSTEVMQREVRSGAELLLDLLASTETDDPPAPTEAGSHTASPQSGTERSAEIPAELIAAMPEASSAVPTRGRLRHRAHALRAQRSREDRRHRHGDSTGALERSRSDRVGAIGRRRHARDRRCPRSARRRDRVADRRLNRVPGTFRARLQLSLHFVRRCWPVRRPGELASRGEAIRRSSAASTRGELVSAAAHMTIGERTQNGAHRRRDQVDPEHRELAGDHRRTERARRVHGSAGDGPREDRCKGDRSADRPAGHGARGTAIGRHGHDHKHQEEREQRFENHGLREGDGRQRRAERSDGPDQPKEKQARQKRRGDLAEDVTRHFSPRKAPRRGERHRDGWIEVRPRDVAGRGDHHHDHQAEGQPDADMGDGASGLPIDHDGTAANEDERERADHLREDFLPHHDRVPATSIGPHPATRSMASVLSRSATASSSSATARSRACVCGEKRANAASLGATWA